MTNSKAGKGHNCGIPRIDSYKRNGAIIFEDFIKSFDSL
jgi:hypothetical protein